ncbi:MAG: hypothetical protein ACI9EF_002133 [Pseudohongiellaceae bacterium]|jgi:hypothetical protein
MNPRALIGVALLGGVVAGLLWIPDGGSADAPLATSAGNIAAPVYSSPSDCAECHPQVVAEWRESMHSQAFTDPQVRKPSQSDNFRKSECLPCHASAPVFAFGIEEDTRVLARAERRQDGIDCNSCHGLPEGGVAASRAGLNGPCLPTYRDTLSSPSLCAPCHNQHQTHDEWRVSPAAAAGQNCRDCHMTRLRREPPSAGAPRSGRSHKFLGGRNKDFALAGLSLTHKVDHEASTLTVTLVNEFAGHNLPSDSRNRALDLVVTVRDALGVEAAPIEGLGDRFPGGATGTARLRFRNPYRSSGKTTTQIPAGEQRELVVPFADNAQSASVELLYKLEPWIPDTEAFWNKTVDVDLSQQ